jgi:hypothetical protein
MQKETSAEAKLQAGPPMMWFFYACCRGSMRSLAVWLAQNFTFSQSINEFFYLLDSAHMLLRQHAYLLWPIYQSFHDFHLTSAPMLPRQHA